MNPKDLSNITLGQIFAAIAALITTGVPATNGVTETEVIPPAKAPKAAKAAKAAAPKEEEADSLLLDEAPAGGDDDDLLGGEPEPVKPAAVTADSLRAQAVVAIKKDAANKAKIAAVLKKVGVDSITNVPPARFEAVMKAFKTLSE